MYIQYFTSAQIFALKKKTFETKLAQPVIYKKDQPIIDGVAKPKYLFQSTPSVRREFKTIFKGIHLQKTGKMSMSTAARSQVKI